MLPSWLIGLRWSGVFVIGALVVGQLTALGQQTPTQNNGLRPATADTRQLSSQPSTTPIQEPKISPPAWVHEPVDPAMEKYLNQLLAYWEKTSSEIKLYRCDFLRWEINPMHCNWRNPDKQLAAHTISRGKIRYSNPDQGMYEVHAKWGFAGPDPEQPEKAKYDPLENVEERWICDGKFIYEFDFINERLYDIELPPDAQGEGLKNSPLPFVFGAKAADIKNRYWIRDITPPNVKGQYWLEAWPKRISDAQMYQRVEIILTSDPFLPRSLVIYPTNYHHLENPSKMVFSFESSRSTAA